MSVSLSISNTHPDVSDFEGNFKFGSGELFQDTDILLYYESKFLVDTTFNAVYSMSSHANNSTSCSDSISHVFYSIQNGVIGIETANGHCWRLK
jgi:hypothetical protein